MTKITYTISFMAIIWYNIYIVYFVILLEVFLVMSGKMTGYALFNRNKKRMALCHALFFIFKIKF